MLIFPAVLTHEQAAATAASLRQVVHGMPSPVIADAASLREFDSSALAVLLACRREALSAGKTFAVMGLPARLRQLATLYGVGDLLPAAAAAA